MVRIDGTHMIKEVCENKSELLFDLLFKKITQI